MAKRLEDYHASALSDMMRYHKIYGDYHQQYQRAYHWFNNDMESFSSMMKH